MTVSPDQFYVNPSSGLPIYRQLMEQIRSLIASKQLRPGMMLPSTRELAATLEVNMMTVSKAFSKLEAEGVVERVRGRGMRVADSQEATSLADRKNDAAEKLEPILRQARQMGLNDQQIQALVQKLLKGMR